MSAADQSFPAFPVPGLQWDDDFNGINVRDYFAAKLMPAIYADTSPSAQDCCDVLGISFVDYDPAEHFLRYVMVMAYRGADEALKVRAL